MKKKLTKLLTLVLGQNSGRYSVSNIVVLCSADQNFLNVFDASTQIKKLLKDDSVEELTSYERLVFSYVFKAYHNKELLYSPVINSSENLSLVELGIHM